LCNSQPPVNLRQQIRDKIGAAGSSQTQSFTTTSYTCRLAPSIRTTLYAIGMLMSICLQWLPWFNPCECDFDLVSGCSFMSFTHTPPPTLAAHVGGNERSYLQALHVIVCWDSKSPEAYSHYRIAIRQPAYYPAHSLFALTVLRSEVELKGIGNKKA
jgi:hypothetical protein